MIFLLPVKVANEWGGFWHPVTTRVPIAEPTIEVTEYKGGITVAVNEQSVIDPVCDKFNCAGVGSIM